jgi:hypothetical protein
MTDIQGVDSVTLWNAACEIPQITRFTQVKHDFTEELEAQRFLVFPAMLNSSTVIHFVFLGRSC